MKLSLGIFFFLSANLVPCVAVKSVESKGKKKLSTSVSSGKKSKAPTFDGCDTKKSGKKTLCPSPPPTPVPTCQLVYQGSVAQIPNGFDCETMTDAEVDARADAACNDMYPGSRNLRGTEIENGKYLEIVDLSPQPIFLFVPSCPGCGLTCDAGGGRLCAVGGWNTTFWSQTHSGEILSAECAIEVCS